MIETGSVVLIIVSSTILSGLLRLKGYVLNVVAFWIAALFQIVLTGYIASAFNHFGDLYFWLAIQGVLLIPLIMIARKIGICWHPFFSAKGLWIQFKRLSRYRQFLLAAPMLTCVVLGIANGLVVLFCTPHQWDALTYHIARVAYYLQNGNLHPYPANYWAQTMHPKVSSVVQAWCFLASGRNENLFQLLQFMSYWVAMLAIYGLCRRLFDRRGPALFAALVFGLLIEVLLQATTPNNDLFLTALIACIVLYLIEFRRNPEWQVLLPGAAAFGLAVGTKASFALVVPSIAVVAAWVFVPKIFALRRESSSQRAKGRLPVWIAQLVVLGSVAGVIMFPAGYFDNLKLYGHPLGSEEVRGHHTFKGESFLYLAGSGTRNILRFGMDFLALECPFPSPCIEHAHDALRRVPRGIFNAVGLDLKYAKDSLAPFTYGKDCTAHEDVSYWGITGFSLAIPLLVSVFFRRKYRSLLLPFATASILFILSQAYGGPYDPWRGRYFIQMAPFTLPMLVFAWDARRWIFRSYVVLVVAFACFTAVCAVGLRPNRPLISMTSGEYKTVSVFGKTRPQQMTANIGGVLDILSYEEAVPDQAVVGVRFPGDMNEYALFGEKLTRTIIPFPAELVGKHSFTGQVDYVVYYGTDAGKSWAIRKVLPGESAEQAFASIRAGFFERATDL